MQEPRRVVGAPEQVEERTIQEIRLMELEQKLAHESRMLEIKKYVLAALKHVLLVGRLHNTFVILSWYT